MIAAVFAVLSTRTNVHPTSHPHPKLRRTLHLGGAVALALSLSVPLAVGSTALELAPAAYAAVETLDFQASASVGQPTLRVQADVIVNGTVRGDLYPHAEIFGPDGAYSQGQLVLAGPGSTIKVAEFADLPDGLYRIRLTVDIDGEPYYDEFYASIAARESDAPVVSAALTPGPNASGWSNTSTTLNIDAVDSAAGVRYIYYSIDKGPSIRSGVSVGNRHNARAAHVFSSNGTRLVDFWAEDWQGNFSEPQSTTVRIDTTGPTIDIASPAEDFTVFVGDELNANFSCEDAASGVASCEGSVPLGESLPTDVAGDFDFTVTATDLAGNTSTRIVTYTVRDIDGPQVTMEPVGVNSSGWLNRGSSVRVSADDASRVVHMYWGYLTPSEELVSGETFGDEAMIQFTESGEYSVWAGATDEHENGEEPVNARFNVDVDDPVISVSVPQPVGLLPGEYMQGQRLVADFECTDALSGIADCEASVPNGEQLPTDEVGEFEFTVTATDVAGNEVTRVVSYRVVASTAPSIPTVLAQTGANALPGLLAAGATLLIGGVLMGIRRLARR